MPKTASRPATIKTELGFKIHTTASHKLAEGVAAQREQVEVNTTNYKRRLEHLLVQMQQDKVSTVKARTAAGFTYEFTVQNKGETVKVRRVVEKKTEKVEKY